MIGAALMPEKDKVWTTKTLAEEGRVQQAYIRQLILAGKLSGYKIGRDWIIPDDEARQWLERRKPK
jgi:excisionase family DNA binding protein